MSFVILLIIGAFIWGCSGDFVVVVCCCGVGMSKGRDIVRRGGGGWKGKGGMFVLSMIVIVGDAAINFIIQKKFFTAIRVSGCV